MAAWRRILKWKEDLAARFCGANNEMFCQLTWWRALGITAQQRPASKMVRRERATPCSSSDLDHRDLQIQFFFLAFSVDMKTKGPFQNPLCLCLRFLFWDSLYGTQHISENGPGRRKKKKKKAGSTQRVTAIYWQTHAIAQTTKHSYYSPSLWKAGGKPVWKHYESRKVPTVTAVRWWKRG